jgi:chaperonin GroES
VLSDPRPASPAGFSFAPDVRVSDVDEPLSWACRCTMVAFPGSAGTAGAGRAGAARSIGQVQDPKLQIQMLHDRGRVRVTDAAGERRSSAGIVIPATAEVAKRLIWGEVFGVGQHVRFVKVGDRVLFGREDHYEVEVQGTAYLVMRERELHAVATELTEHGTGLYL